MCFSIYKLPQWKFDRESQWDPTGIPVGHKVGPTGKIRRDPTGIPPYPDGIPTNFPSGIPTNFPSGAHLYPSGIPANFPGGISCHYPSGMTQCWHVCLFVDNVSSISFATYLLITQVWQLCKPVKVNLLCWFKPVCIFNFNYLKLNY